MTRITDSSCEPFRETNFLWNKIQKNNFYPLNVMLVLAERCPLKCPHCYVPDKKADKELSLEKITSLLDELAETNAILLSLTGGEPCLREDLVEIVKRAVKRNFSVSLKTSACTLCDNDVENLWNAGLSELRVSLYHTDPKLHDKFVGYNGAFKKATMALDKFSALGGRVWVHVVAMNWNVKSVFPLFDLCDKNGWGRGAELRILNRLDGSKKPLELQASCKQLIKLLSNTTFLPGLVDARKTALKKPPVINKRTCMAAQNGVSISPAGDVHPCVMLPVSMGNIHKTPYAEIIKNSKVKKEILGIKYSGSKKCSSCEMLWACDRCLSTAFFEHGDLKQPSKLDCRMAKVRTTAVKNGN